LLANRLAEEIIVSQGNGDHPDFEEPLTPMDSLLRFETYIQKMRLLM
jgi:hypothetical protein